MINNNKVAIITGGAIRVGKIISQYLIKNGWLVIIHYNSSAKGARAILDDYGKDKVKLLQRDFSQELNAEIFFDDAHSCFNKQPSLLINNASSFIGEKMENLGVASFHQQMNVNCIMPMLLSAEFKKRTSEGCVINILDFYALSNDLHYFAHQITKSSLLKATKQLALSCAPNIRVNAITLSVVMATENQSDKSYSRELGKSVVKKPIERADICLAIDFLINTRSVTGQNIILDNGRSLL